MKRALALLALLIAAVPPLAADEAPAPESVAILLFEGVQIIDFTGPYEVFGQAVLGVDLGGGADAVFGLDAAQLGEGVLAARAGRAARRVPPQVLPGRTNLPQGRLALLGHARHHEDLPEARGPRGPSENSIPAVA